MRTDGRTRPSSAASTMVAGEVGAGRLLGCRGSGLLAVAEYGDEVELFVETDADETGCPLCGVVAVLLDRLPRQLRGLPLAGRLVVLAWSTRVWRCWEPLCWPETWSERTEAVRPKRC